MKKTIGFGCTLLVFAVALTTIAAAPKQVFEAPMDAAENHRTLRTLLRSYQRDGFVIYNNFENAYRYIATPGDDFDWGTVTYQLRSAEGTGTTATHVTLTAYARYIDQSDGYQINGFDVREHRPE